MTEIYGTEAIHSDCHSPSSNLPRKRARASHDGPFPCLMAGCGSSFHNAKGWRDHQNRVHFPPNIFICGRNENGVQCKHLIYRIENAKDHLKRKHASRLDSDQSRGAEVAKRTKEVRNHYHDVCGFCKKKIGSREESMDHIVDHLKRMANNGNAAQRWIHQCSSDHKLKEGVHYDLTEDESDMDHDLPHDFDGDCGGSGASGSLGSTFQDVPRFSSNAQGGSQMNSKRCPESSPSRAHNTDTESVGSSQLSAGSRGFKLPFSTKKLLGSGAFGRVYEVQNKTTGQLFAMKKIPWNQFKPDADSARLRILREIDIMRKLRHQHIVRYCGSFSTRDGFAIVMQPSAVATLADLFKSPEAIVPQLGLVQHFLPDALTLSMSCLASAVDHLHMMSISHNDIKPRNVLLLPEVSSTQNGWQIFLADFGISEPYHVNAKETRCQADGKAAAGTPRYHAPEVQCRSGSETIGWSGHKADIWSLGCIFAEVLTFALKGKSGLQSFESFRATNEGNTAYYKSLNSTQEWLNYLEQLPDCQESQNHTQAIIDLTRIMLDKNPQNRPTARGIWSKLPKRSCCSGFSVDGEGGKEDRRAEYPLQGALNLEPKQMESL